MLFICVVCNVFKDDKSRVSSDEQLANMPLIFMLDTAEVSSPARFTDVRFEQSSNM